MPQGTQKLALPFSTYRGNNIEQLNDYIAKAAYERAHGQILLQHELVPGQTFDLDICGKGIIKIRAFSTKRAAEDWVHSRSPLGKGSIRIRTRNMLRCKVSVPTPGAIVLSTKKKHRQNHLAGSVLAFDIEYGDLVVMVLNGNNNNAVQFDTSCRSRHVEIVNSSKVCHATLHHYNPTSLCTPKDRRLSPGQLFKMEVRGPDDPRHTGSYVRVCVSGMCHEYSNGITRCEGTRDTPECQGKRLMIRPERTEVFVIKVVEDGVCVERAGEMKYFLQSPITRCDLGLWFEMHRVEMRLWLLRAKRDGEAPSSDDEPPPEYPAPPPPRLVKRREERSPVEADCWRSTGHRGFTCCEHALVESSSLSSEDSCRYISIQRDDNDTSSYVTVDCCMNQDCSWAPDSDETFTAGMFDTEASSQSPPLPPKPCTSKFGGLNKCPESCREPSLQDFGTYVSMHRPTQEPSDRCSSWVSQHPETPPAHCSARRTTVDRSASISEASSFFINYSRSLRHELDIDLQDERSLHGACRLDDSPGSPSCSFSSMSSFSSISDFGLSQDESIGSNEVPETKPVPCFSRRQRTRSLESTSEGSEMSIDEETDRKTLNRHKSSAATSSYESKSQKKMRNFCGNPLLQTQSSTESESEEGCIQIPFSDQENELSKDDIVLREPRKINNRNIVESSITNLSQDSSTAIVEDGPTIRFSPPIITKPELLDRSSTIKRNLNDEAKIGTGAKCYNLK